jgi:hypothetical protein
MAIERVQEWISSGKSYTEGVRLFSELSDDDFLKELFSESDDEYNRGKLFDELTKLNVPKNVKSEDPDPVISGQAVITTSAPDRSFRTYSELKKQKWDSIAFTPQVKEWAIICGELTKKIDNLKAQIELLQTKRERFEHAREIQESAKLRAAYYEKIDYYNLHGALPEEVAIDPKKEKSEHIKKFQHYKNILTRISKEKNNPDKRKYQELVFERDQLKEELGL